jgi:import inner membrane translocase subunit TIM23
MIASPFSTSHKLSNQCNSPRPHRASRTLSTSTNPSLPSLCLRSKQPPATTTTPRRHASTARPSDAQVDARAASAAAKADAAAHPEQPPLDWNTFFQLRKSRRRWQVAFSVASLLGSGTAGALFVSTGAAEPLANQIPLDPLVTLGLITFSFAALGWLAGPSIGSAVFYSLNRKWKAQMTLKEGLFFARVKKNRVDPSASSAGNPGKLLQGWGEGEITTANKPGVTVPDFYGEKISSVAGYRQWLKDQRAFNKKRTTFV